ncbi:hypothetical protein Tco_1311280 [Tanacetum coccineum]
MSIVFKTPPKNYKDTYDEVDEEFSTVIHHRNDNVLPLVDRRDLANESRDDYYRKDRGGTFSQDPTGIPKPDGEEEGTDDNLADTKVLEKEDAAEITPAKTEVHEKENTLEETLAKEPPVATKEDFAEASTTRVYVEDLANIMPQMNADNVTKEWDLDEDSPIDIDESDQENVDAGDANTYAIHNTLDLPSPRTNQVKD